MIKLISTDVDGVIFDIHSSWREFHKKLGTYDLERLEKLRNSYLKGKISYLEWANEEVKVWKGIEYNEFVKICNNFPLVKNAEETVNELKKRGYILIAISSGGVLRAVEKRLKKMGFDYVYSNDLEEENGIVTGKFILNVEHHNKHKILEKIAKENNLSLKECAVIGDDITDLTLIRRAGFSIAFCPKNEKLIKHADVVINEKDLSLILKYFPHLEKYFI